MTDLDLWCRHHISAFTAFKISFFSPHCTVDSSKSTRINSIPFTVSHLHIGPHMFNPSSIFSDRFQSGIHIDLISFLNLTRIQREGFSDTFPSQMSKTGSKSNTAWRHTQAIASNLKSMLFDEMVHTGNLLMPSVERTETAFQSRGKDLYDDCAASSPALVQRTWLCSPHHLLPLCQISEGQEPALSRWIR